MRPHNEVDNYAGPESPELNAYLADRHGECYMGFPTYRVVLSSHVLSFSAGTWCDWDTNLPVELRGRLVANEDATAPTPESRAERQVTEMRLVEDLPELHDIPGWILQRWMAPAYWGTPTEWQSRTAPGTDLPTLGPFPFQGKYMLIAGPYPEAPSGPFLDRIIEQWELMREEVLAYAADTYTRKKWHEAVERDRLRSERWNREASAANMTAMQPLFSTFLEAGRARQIAAEHAGIDSNYGS